MRLRVVIFCLIILIFFMLNSCATTVTNLTDVRWSFIRIGANTEAKKCFPAATKDDKERCVYEEDNGSASGVVVKEDKKGTYILTAGHVCDKKRKYISRQFGKMDSVKVNFTAYTWRGLYHPLKIYKIDLDHDICILLAKKRLGIPIVKVRTYGPSYAEKVWNFAAPLGISDTSYLPVFEGRYVGFDIENDIYQIPGISGSSGSPVVDSDARLVGMIITVVTAFPFITFSPEHHTLKAFVEEL